MNKGEKMVIDCNTCGEAAKICAVCSVTFSNNKIACVSGDQGHAYHVHDNCVKEFKEMKRDGLFKK